MAILDVRIDDRLIHGQVCGFWIPQYSLERIAIVDDKIAYDEPRKTALKFGCPARCKLSIFDTDKAAEKFSRKIDEGVRVMILCNSPVPVLQMAQKGYQVPFLTIGNMSTKPNAQQLRKTVFVSPEEMAAFQELAKLGVTVYNQMVPSEPREDITKQLLAFTYKENS